MLLASAHSATTDATTASKNQSTPSSAIRNPIDVYILQDVEAMEFEASSSNGTLPSELIGILLTDSHNPNVLRHQLDILETEFPVDVSGASPSSSSRNAVMLQSLVAIEERYSQTVASCKKKDDHRAASIIGEFAYCSTTTTGCYAVKDDDPVILSALGRANSIRGLVNRILLRVQATES